MKYLHRLLIFYVGFGLIACQPQSPNPTTAPVSAAQNAPQFNGSDIRHDPIGGDFTLTDGSGKPFTLSNLKGQVVVLSFGFTNCPDVCPTQLQTYAEAVRQIPDWADKISVVFVSIDPDRDTPKIVGQYVAQFDKKFIGLSVSGSQNLAEIKKQYRVFAEKSEVKSPTEYVMSHSSGAYVLNQQNQAVLFLPHGLTATQIAQDLQQILKEK